MTNLVINPCFDDNFNNWIVSGFVIGTISHCGSTTNSALITGPVVNSSLGQNGIGTGFGSYTLTYYIYLENTPTNPFDIITTIRGPGNLILFEDVTSSTSLTIDDWTVRSFPYVAIGATSIEIHVLAPNSTEFNLYFDDFSIIESVICFSGNSLIYAKNIETGIIENVLAKDIISGVHQVFSTIEQKFVPVIYNIVTGPTRRYMWIKKNAIAPDQPSSNFYVTSGHYLMINGVKIKAGKIPQAKRIKVKPEMVYTICTNEGGPILVNGLEVFSYNYDEWIEYAACKKLVWSGNIIQNKTMNLNVSQ